MTNKQTIYQSIITVQSEVENVIRDTKGQIGNQIYKYATLTSVLDMLKPLFSKNNLAVLQWIVGDDLATTIIHESGEKLECGLYPLGNFVKQQERGSAVSYGRRYVLCAIFGVTQEDDDGKAASESTDAKRVFSNASKRKDFENKVAELLKNAGSLDDLKGVWTDNYPVLQDLKNSPEDYENQSYGFLEKIKEQCKSTLVNMGDEFDVPNHMRD